MDSTKLCECGCGQPTRPAKQTITSLGVVKGLPRRFIKQHHKRRRLVFQVEDCGYETPCYVWKGSVDHAGYGVFKRNGGVYKAHRQSLIYAEGPLAPNIRACHHCDNPPCIRPDHLFAGTQRENILDMYAKGRHGVVVMNGERNPIAKFTNQQAARIIRRYEKEGISMVKLAREYGVCVTTISNLIHGKTYSGVKRH